MEQKRTFTIDLDEARTRPRECLDQSVDLWEVARFVENALQLRFDDPLFVESVEIKGDNPDSLTKLNLTIGVASQPVDTIGRFSRQPKVK